MTPSSCHALCLISAWAKLWVWGFQFTTVAPIFLRIPVRGLFLKTRSYAAIPSTSLWAAIL